jgi:hypothetical protein
MSYRDGSGNAANRGLCLNCANDDGCTYSSRVAAIHFCEDHSEVRAAPKDDAGYEPPRYNRSAYPGLCSNCANVKSCAHADLESGVWHCENYE